MGKFRDVSEVCSCEDPYIAYLDGRVTKKRAVEYMTNVRGATLVNIKTVRMFGKYRNPTEWEDVNGSGSIFTECKKADKDAFPVTKVTWEDEL